MAVKFNRKAHMTTRGSRRAMNFITDILHGGKYSAVFVLDQDGVLREGTSGKEIEVTSPPTEEETMKQRQQKGLNK